MGISARWPWRRAPARAEDIVARLADQPRLLSDLEAIIGPVRLSFDRQHMENMGGLFRPRPGETGEFSDVVPRLFVKYAFDMFHQDPARPRDPELTEYSLQMRGDRSAVEAVLAQRFGAPRDVVEHFPSSKGVITTVYAQHGPFFLADGGVHDITLRWYRTTPRFAIPEADPDARRTWLAALRDALTGEPATDAVAAAVQRVDAAAGVTAEPSTFDGSYWIEFVPPAPALLIIDVFGWERAAGVSTDVHMSSWHIERLDEPGRPVIGNWELEAHLARPPSGDLLQHERRGPGTPRGIAEPDEVRGLTIRPRAAGRPA